MKNGRTIKVWGLYPEWNEDDDGNVLSFGLKVGYRLPDQPVRGMFRYNISYLAYREPARWITPDAIFASILWLVSDESEIPAAISAAFYSGFDAVEIDGAATLGGLFIKTATYHTQENPQ